MVLVGNDPMPTTVWQTAISAFGTILGIIVMSGIIGSATSLVASLDSYAEEKKDQMDSIRQYLAYRRVPREMRVQVLRFYDYLLYSGHSARIKKLFAQLPETLSLKLNLCLKYKLVESCKLFKQCSAGTTIEIIRKLVPRIAQPSEPIIREGQVNEHLYFITRGVADVLIGYKSNGTGKHLATLHQGSMFGESSLLADNHIAGATVVPPTFIELETLGLLDFITLTDTCPDFYNFLTAESKRRLNSNKERQMAKHLRLLDKVTHLWDGKPSRTLVGTNAEEAAALTLQHFVRRWLEARKQIANERKSPKFQGPALLRRMTAFNILTRQSGKSSEIMNSSLMEEIVK